MEDNWQLVYSSPYIYQVEIVQAVLIDFDIKSVVINKQDSSYHFVEVELYVEQDNVIRAKQIINREGL